MKKGLIASIIQLIAVGCVLTLTVVSFAWYSGNKVVNTTVVSINAAATSDIAIQVTSTDDYVPYKGQTGLGYLDESHPELAVDMPYTATKEFYATFKPDKNNYAFCSYFSEINIVKHDNTIVNLTTDPLIRDAFTYRMHIYDLTTKELIATYAPDKDGFIILTSGTEETNGSYLYVPVETTYSCGFELIFLDEASYAKWLNADYSNVTEFKYDDYSFMKAIYNITFIVGLDIPPVE